MPTSSSLSLFPVCVCRTVCEQYCCIHIGTITDTVSVCQTADTLWEARLCEKPQPRGCRQTPGTIRHSRAYLFNRMCYSITASLSQRQSFKYPFVFWSPQSFGASQDKSRAVYVFGYAARFVWECAQEDVHKCDFWGLWSIKKGHLFLSNKQIFHYNNYRQQRHVCFKNDSWKRLSKSFLFQLNLRNVLLFIYFFGTIFKPPSWMFF